jgi:hypothetical protein
MRLEKSCLCFTLRHGALISISFDMLKILISLMLLLIYITTGENKGGGLRTQTVQMPQHVRDSRGPHGEEEDFEHSSALQLVVIFVGDAVRYSIAGIMGIVMLSKKWSALYTGTYFWVKFISSFLNMFSALLMVTLTQLPFSEMILSIGAFATD